MVTCQINNVLSIKIISADIFAWHLKGDDESCKSSEHSSRSKNMSTWVGPSAQASYSKWLKSIKRVFGSHVNYAECLSGSSGSDRECSSHNPHGCQWSLDLRRLMTHSHVTTTWVDGLKPLREENEWSISVDLVLHLSLVWPVKSLI